MNRAFAVLKRTATETLKDRVMELAAAMSYYAVFSIFPLLIGAVVLASFFLDSEQVQSQLFSFVGEQVPVGEPLLRETVQNVIQARGQAGIFAILSLLWAGSNIFAAISKSVNRIWGVEHGRGFLAEQAIRIAMLFGAGALLLAYVLVTAVSRVLIDLPITISGFSLFNNPLFSTIVSLLPLGLIFMIFLLTYKLLPVTRVPWRPAIAGALLAAVLFEIAKYAFVFYVENFAHMNLVYGSLAGVIVLFLWAYFSSVILLFGAEFTSVLAEPAAKDSAAPTPVSGLTSQPTASPTAPTIRTPVGSKPPFESIVVDVRPRVPSGRRTTVWVAATSAMIGAGITYLWSVVGRRGARKTGP